MQNYFCLLCIEIVHLPSVLHVHKGGPGGRIGFLWFSAAGESSALVWVLVPSPVTSRGSLTNREWVELPIKSLEQQHCVLITFPARQLSGEIFLSCCWKASEDFTDRKRGQVGCFEMVPSCPGFIQSFPCQPLLPSQSIRAAQILHLILCSQSCSLQQMLILTPAGSDPFELSDMRLNVNLWHIIIGLYVISRIMESKC